MKAMWDEFKTFAMKGNVIDLAIGVIIGAAFTPIVSTLVANIMMPIIGYVTAGVDFSVLAVTPIAIPTSATTEAPRYSQSASSSSIPLLTM